MSPRTRDTGPVAIVTGAGSGIGRATALRLAQDGMAVACFDLKGGEPTRDVIVQTGGRAVYFNGDVSEPEHWKELLSLVHAELGEVQVLANIAGIFSTTDSLVTVSSELIHRMIGTNLMGPILGMRAVLPAMIERRSGKIVNISSAATVMRVPGTAIYSATKGAIETLTGQAAREYGKFNIQINAISPGAVDTPMLRSNRPESVEAILASRGAKGLASPEQPAGVISFLASNAADYINGVVIRCGE